MRSAQAPSPAPWSAWSPRASWSPRPVGTPSSRTGTAGARRGQSDTGWQTVARGEARVDGRDVAAPLQPAAPGVLVLSTGYPSPDLQPLAALTAAAVRATRRPDGWALAPAAGLPELRSLPRRSGGGRHRPRLPPRLAASRTQLPECRCPVPRLQGSHLLVDVSHPWALRALPLPAFAGHRRCPPRRSCRLV